MYKKILVLGSSNIDLILRIPRFHHPGETILAENLVTVFGGKGANQAIASKRLGGRVTFLTKLGNDHYGESYRRYLIKNGLPAKGLLRDRRLPTGIALIELNPESENRIIVSPGANRSLSAKDLQGACRLWETAGVFVSQLEIPISTVTRGLKTAKNHGALTLLNPSPPVPLSSEILSLIDYLVPNELEAQTLTGLRFEGEKDLPKIAQRLLSRGIKNVVITLGPRGLYFRSREEEIRMRAFSVKAVDTTAAGDAFMGGLAYALSEGRAIQEALKFANGAGALATTKLGAQPSLPSKKELEKFLLKMV